MSSGVFLVNIEQISHIILVSNVEFEQVTANWTGYIKKNPTILFFHIITFNTRWKILLHECPSINALWKKIPTISDVFLIKSFDIFFEDDNNITPYTY